MNSLDKFSEMLCSKISKLVSVLGDSFPFITENGKYVTKGNWNSITWWTNGFWPGILWLMYYKTGDETYMTIAQSCEQKLDAALLEYVGLYHDVGFMWSLSAVADYKLTGSERSKERGLAAAGVLASRFNPNGNFIRAWNGKGMEGRAIVDCLMNLPILYWAGDTEQDPRFYAIARRHTGTVLEHFIREDGSCEHIVDFDAETGAVTAKPGGQGYGEDSAWSRGQAWAIYGLALGYAYTGVKRYLDAAKKVAHFFLASLDESFVPLSDFRAPSTPVITDASAGAIAACGLLEIATHVNENEKGTYQIAAKRLVTALQPYCDFTDRTQAILKGSSGSYHDILSDGFIFGDYFLLEALMRLTDSKTPIFW